MKKIMPLMAAALVSLSACSKSANEPAVKNQNDEALETINITIEGEREDVSVLDENGRALNLKGSAQGDKLTGITLKDGKVDGIIYIYKVTNSSGEPAQKRGIARRVTFDVHNNKVSYRGDLNTGHLRPGQLPYELMDVYIGGQIGTTTINDGTRYPRGGFVQYHASKKAVRTEDGMDLSVLNPLFYSTGMKITRGDKPAAGKKMNYYSTGHKFKLYGEFVSFRFRMTNRAQARFNGLLVRGFGIGGIALNEPSSTSKYVPKITVQNKTDKHTLGTFIAFPGNQTYYIDGDGQQPYKTLGQPTIKSDDAYTIYLFTPAEPNGGVRMGYSKTPNIFINGSGNNANNIPSYWGTSATQPYTSGGKNYGKFHNLVILLSRK